MALVTEVKQLTPADPEDESGVIMVHFSTPSGVVKLDTKLC